MSPVDVTFPDVEKIIAKIGTFKSIDVMWDSVVPNIDAFHINIDTVSANIKRRFEDLLSRMKIDYSVSVRLGALMLPNDYDPPQYVGVSDLVTSTEEEVSFYKEKSDVSASTLTTFFCI